MQVGICINHKKKSRIGNYLLLRETSSSIAKKVVFWWSFECHNDVLFRTNAFNCHFFALVPKRVRSIKLQEKLSFLLLKQSKY
jgi:hypothetical protein